MKGVTVTLSGPIGCGKSTIGTIIKQALINYGYEVHIQIIADGEDISDPQLINATYNIGAIDGNAIRHDEDHLKMVTIIEDCSLGEDISLIEEYSASDGSELPELSYEKTNKVTLPKLVSDNAKKLIKKLLEVGNGEMLPSEMTHYLTDNLGLDAKTASRTIIEVFSSESVTTDENMFLVLDFPELWKERLENDN